MKIRNKKTGKTICIDTVVEIIAIVVITAVIVVLFKPVMSLALDLYLSIGGK